MPITTIGLDLAKRIFQVHGVDAGGNVVTRRRLQRLWSLPSSVICRSAWRESNMRNIIGRG
jgi:hypothetical protein